MALQNTSPGYNSMATIATTASTDMRLLLRDDIFVDFFNTFLNLPVFGQTPIYISSTGRWDLWPELPSCLDPSPPALLAWLEKHRLPHFCKSSLCLHLVLCQKLLGFIRSGEAAKLLNWQSADQWLLEKCISGSQGMWHFWAFVQGKAGEELTNFWLTTERLLELDESDARQRDLCLSLLHKLKATHLREGSSVITLCTTIPGPYCSKKAKVEIWTLVKEGRDTQEMKMSRFQVLCCLYEEFLADDDRTFLQFMPLQSDAPMPKMQGYAVGEEECFILSQQINESLKLSQTLHGTRNLEGLSSEHWRLIATRDLRKWGSIQPGGMNIGSVLASLSDADSQNMSNVLAVQKPSLAVDSPSKENELLCLKSPSLDLPISSMESSNTRCTSSSHTASSSTPPDKELGLVKHHLFNSQLITVNFLVDDLRFYLEIDKFSRLADSVEALAARNMQSEKEVAFLKRKAAIISKLFLNSDIPSKLRVNISEEERDLIWHLSSKGLLTRILYHRAQVIIFPILMHFWRRFCTWKVMRSFQVSTKDIVPISLPSTKTSSEPPDVYSPTHVTPVLQPPNSFAVKEMWVTHVLAQPPFLDLRTSPLGFKGDNTSCCPPSFATPYRFISSPSPSNHTIIVFTLLKGIQILLPKPQKKTKLPEEQKDSDKSCEKRLSIGKSASCPAEQAPREGQTSKEDQTSQHTIHTEQDRGVLQGR
ncbi:unnamed protein product [Bubo scandiacus]